MYVDTYILYMCVICYWCAMTCKYIGILGGSCFAGLCCRFETKNPQGIVGSVV